MSEPDKDDVPAQEPIVSPEEPETNIKNISINNEIKNSIMESVIEENNPIVNQLIEFGYNNIYSRRVFHYLHPEDLEEALNYMAIENNIIQHRFVKNNRNKSDILCYVCGEKPEIHLKELNINIRGHNESNDNDSNNDEDINKSKNSNEKTGGIFQVIKAEIKSEITNSKNEVQNLSFSQKLSEEKINNINNRSKDDTVSENIPNIKNDTMTVTKNQKTHRSLLGFRVFLCGIVRNCERSEPLLPRALFIAIILSCACSELSFSISDDSKISVSNPK